MILKFYAREDQLVREPGIGPSIGVPARYVGRYFDAALRGFPAHDNAQAFDTDLVESRDIADLKRSTRKGGLWPADTETAAECGVPFVAVEAATQDVGGKKLIVGWVPKKAAQVAVPAPKSTRVHSKESD